MSLTKVQAEGINLADTFAFSGTVSGTSVAGADAFCANGASDAWASASANTILFFPDDSSNDNFDTGNRFDTSTYKYTARADGVYLFWYSVYTADNDASNGFGFLKNSTKIQMQNNNLGIFTFHSNNTNDHIQNGTIILPLSANDTMAVITTSQSDYYRGHSQFGGCRLA
tara:strand:+ start:43 stop:552 length:510 start_codon:yes stop_codon:yes gene_type:complete